MVFKRGGSAAVPKKKKKAEVRKEEEGFWFYPKSSNVKRRSRRRWGNGVAKAGVDPWSLETGSETGIKQKIGHKPQSGLAFSQCNNGFAWI